MAHARTLVITTLLMTALCVSVQAQERRLLTTTVPFSFTVGQTDMPAGTYSVYILPPHNAIRIQSANGQNVAMLSPILQASVPSGDAKMVFRRIDNHYYLAQITESGSQVGRDLWTNSNLARELAKNGGKVQSKTVVASANNSH